MNYVIVDDLVTKVEQRRLEVAVLDRSDMDWRYSPKSTASDLDAIEKSTKVDPNIFVDPVGSFCHNLYYDPIGVQPAVSPFYSLVENFPAAIEQKFNVKVNRLLRMHIMLTMPDPKNQSKYGIPHVDYTEYPTAKTIVYYINDSTGDTVLFNEKYQSDLDTNIGKKNILTRVSPKKGRAVMFDTLQFHAASRSHTNHRAILNINFI